MKKTAALREYHRKRRFEETPEPAGAAVPEGKPGHSFVIQKHDATRLHYDFRLEIGGVLVSWAVPKGPSLNPADKRLAVMTEDHPLEYGGFEGVIPKGNYGAGPVMVWDNGTFEPEGELSAADQLARGEIKFKLYGRKLKGSWVLVRTRRPTVPEGKDWLLIKHRDEFVDANWDIDKLDWSVLSGRTLAEIERGIATHAGTAADLPGARKAPMPKTIEPMLAILGDKPFSGPEWVFELKWDGMRVIAWLRDGSVELQSRRARVVTSQFPELAGLSECLSVKSAILDGEVVVLDEQGKPDFGQMQQRMNVAHPSKMLVDSYPVTYYVFDLLYCDGYDLRSVPLIERKKLLKSILAPGTPVRYSDHVAGKGKELYKLAKEQGLEGIIAKQKKSKYESRRSNCWVKLKTTRELDAVIGGFTAPRGSRGYFGAVLLGLYDKGKLQFIAGAGTGFTEQSQAELWEKLQTLVTKECPFAKPPVTREKAQWVKPKLVARVKYSQWTHEGSLRAPVFLGLRDDLNPEECTMQSQGG